MVINLIVFVELINSFIYANYKVIDVIFEKLKFILEKNFLYYSINVCLFFSNHFF